MTAATRPQAGLRDYVILVVGIFGFSFSAIFARWADAPGIVVATWRVTTATLVLTLLYLRQPPARRRFTPALRRYTLLGGVMFTFALGTFHVALDYTTAANATFIGNIAPLWVGVFTVVVLKEALPGLFWPGLVVALAGAALIIFGGQGGIDSVRIGDIIQIGNSIVWATYQVMTNQARARLSTLTWVWGVVTVSTVILIPLVGGVMQEPLFGYDTATTIAMLGAGLVSQVGGFLAFNYALGRLPAARVSVANILQPVFTAVAAFILLGEAFGGLRLVGGGLTLLGVYLATVASRPGDRP